jgi:hypothetical protein
MYGWHSQWLRAWQKVGFGKWKCLDSGRIKTYKKGEIKENVKDTSDWIAQGYTLLSLNKYVKEINSYISEGSN